MVTTDVEYTNMQTHDSKVFTAEGKVTSGVKAAVTQQTRVFLCKKSSLCVNVIESN